MEEARLLNSWNQLIRPYKIAFEREDEGDRKDSVVVEPLEKGFGITLGNSLRRVLLSSIQGSAVVAVKINGAVLEFSHLPGVVEDVPDIILNLKALRLRLLGKTGMNAVALKNEIEAELGEEGILARAGAVEEAPHFHGQLRGAAGLLEGAVQEFIISVKGPHIVTAGDIQCDGRLEVLEPEQVICTLGEGATFEAVVAIAQGRGNFVAPIFSLVNGKSVGEILIDACFSPIKKVAYHVENARVGQSTDYDRLVMAVETNGAITPKEAISEAALILQDQLKHFVSLTVPGKIVAQKVPQKLPSQTLPPALFMLVKELDLPVRCYNCLKNANIVYVGDLVQKQEAELLRAPHFGRKSLNDIYDVLGKLGLTLGMAFSGWPPDSHLQPAMI